MDRRTGKENRKVEMQQLQEQIVQWAHDRNIIEGSSIYDQAKKLVEEMGELFNGINKGKPVVVVDSIGDIAVVLTILEAIHYREQGSPIEFRNHLNMKGSIYLEGEDITLIKTEADIAMLTSGMLTDAVRYDQSNTINIIEGIWDALYHYTELSHIDLYDCVKSAYDEIKDRKGKLVDGVFIKDE